MAIIGLLLIVFSVIAFTRGRPDSFHYQPVQQVVEIEDGAYYADSGMRHSLRALETNMDAPKISGSFFLGIGSIHTEAGELGYYFIMENKGGWEIRRIPIAKGRVIETESESPHVLLFDKMGDGRALNPSDSSTVGFYEFYIPKGSLISGYEVDLK